MRQKIEVNPGDRYDAWTVVREIDSYAYKSVDEGRFVQNVRQILCKCTCGTKKVVLLANLRQSKSRNCGCKR